MFTQICIVGSFTWFILRPIDFLTHFLALEAEKTESKVDDQIIQFIKEGLKLLAIVFSLLFILGAIFKLDIGSLVAGLGIGGLAIALAAQDTLENMMFGSEFTIDKKKNSVKNHGPRNLNEVRKLIKKAKPRFFLFSAGGNDVVGMELVRYLDHASSSNNPSVRTAT